MELIEGSGPIFRKSGKKGLLMLHGFTGTPHEFRAFADYFEKMGFSISVPLLSGHGNDISQMNTIKWRLWFEDVKNALFELRKICDEIIIFGQSMGGTLALHLAAHYQVEGLILLAPGMFLKNKFTPVLNIVSVFKKYLDKQSGPDIKNDISRTKAISYDKTPLKAVLELKKLFYHVKDDLEDIYSPALIFHSKEDHVIDYKSSSFIHSKISSKNKKFLTLENSYHVLSLDNDKSIIRIESEKFINQIFT